MVCFYLLFAGDDFAGTWSIDSAIPCLEHETFLQMAPWFQRCIWLAASRIQSSLWELLNSALCLSHNCRALPRANLHISVFRACTMHPKVASVSSGTKALAALGGKSERLCLLFVSWMTESGSQNIWEAIRILEHPIDFHEFQEQIRYSHNSRHVCFWATESQQPECKATTGCGAVEQLVKHHLNIKKGRSLVRVVTSDRCFLVKWSGTSDARYTKRMKAWKMTEGGKKNKENKKCWPHTHTHTHTDKNQLLMSVKCYL